MASSSAALLANASQITIGGRTQLNNAGGDVINVVSNVVQHGFPLRGTTAGLRFIHHHQCNL